jgi:transposase
MVLDLVNEKILLGREAGKLLDLSPAQISKLLKRYNLEGEEGLEHKLKGRPSNNMKPPEVREMFARLVKGAYAGLAPAMVRELLKEEHGVSLGYETVRRWMIKDAAWRPGPYDPIRRRRIPGRPSRKEGGLKGLVPRKRGPKPKGASISNAPSPKSAEPAGNGRPNTKQ